MDDLSCHSTIVNKKTTQQGQPLCGSSMCSYLLLVLKLFFKLQFDLHWSSCVFSIRFHNTAYPAKNTVQLVDR